jgi:WD40 repeat protein
MLRSLFLSLAMFAIPIAYADDFHEQVTIKRAFVAEFGITLRSAVASPDGKMLVTASSGGGEAVIWNPATGKKIAKLPEGNSLYALAFSPDGGTLAGSAESYSEEDEERWSEVLLWDMKTCKITGRLKRKGLFVSRIAFAPDGKTLATDGDRETNEVRIWDIKSGKIIVNLEANADGVWSMAFSSDGKALVIGYRDGTVRVWDVGTGKKTATLTGHKEWVMAVAFDPNGKSVVTAGDDKTVRRWDLATEKATETIELKEAARPYHICFSAKLDTIATTDNKGGLTIWDTKTGSISCQIKDKNDCGVLAYSSEGKWLAADPREGKSDVGLRGLNTSIHVWKIGKPESKQ